MRVTSGGNEDHKMGVLEIVTMLTKLQDAQALSEAIEAVGIR